MSQSKLPSIPVALRFRSEQMGWSDSTMALNLGMQKSHYSEVLSAKRQLPLRARKNAHRLGVPAKVLLQ